MFVSKLLQTAICSSTILATFIGEIPRDHALSNEAGHLRLEKQLTPDKVKRHTNPSNENMHGDDNESFHDAIEDLEANMMNPPVWEFRHLDSFSNEEASETKIASYPFLNFKVDHSFSNLKGSLFELLSHEQLKFSVAGSDEHFVNSGTFRLGSENIDFRSSAPVQNQDQISMYASQKGSFSFNKVENNGKISLYSGGQSASYKFDDINNTGQLYVRFNGRKLSAMNFLGPVDNSGVMAIIDSEGGYQISQKSQIRNSGLICLSRVLFQQTADIVGDGCWEITTGSINLDPSQVFDEAQKIVLNRGLAFVEVRDFKESGNTYDLYGIQNVRRPIRALFKITKLTVDSDKGHLMVYRDENTYVTFNIGKGFQAKDFKIVNSAVEYTGTPATERELPSQCKCSQYPERFQEVIG